MGPTGSEQGRTSFCIDDELYLDFQQVAADQLASDWNHDTANFCDGLIRLRELSLQSSHILANIRKQHHDIAHYLALLDKKIDILAQLAGTIGLGREIKPNHRVNISAEGLRFEHSQPLPVESPLRLKLVLFPSHLCLQLQSRVVSCNRGQAGFRIGVAFERLGETEHEVLIRHLLEKQSAALRRERGE